MRWIDPKSGDKRKRRKFLVWPKRIWNEVRWLETTSWIEVYDAYMGVWKATVWLNEEPQR